MKLIPWQIGALEIVTAAFGEASIEPKLLVKSSTCHIERSRNARVAPKN